MRSLELSPLDRPSATTPSKCDPKPVDDAGEPQNALTKQFMPLEWEALRALRSRLADIIRTAFPTENRSTASIWGVTLDPAKPDARASVVLIKFLRACGMNPADAGRMLLSTLKWRSEWHIDKVVMEDFADGDFKPLGDVFGRDKLGHPVIYNLYGETHVEAVRDMQRFLRWRVQAMERAVMLLDFQTLDQVVQVEDCDTFGANGAYSASAQAASEASALFRNYYPDLEYRRYFVNAPLLLRGSFWLLKMYQPRTYAQPAPVWCRKAKSVKELVVVIEKAQLPQRYGGDATPF